jgi:hypothetical protein
VAAARPGGPSAVSAGFEDLSAARMWDILRELAASGLVTRKGLHRREQPVITP